MLFKNYPQINYNFGNRSVTLVDIFKNISFTNTDNNLAFDEYMIQDGETAEDVSLKFYGTTSYAWLVLLVNNKIDIKKDWYISTEEYTLYKENTLGGVAMYVPALPNIQQGDIIVKVLDNDGSFSTQIDNTVYRHIASFDPYLRKIRGISGAGEFVSGDLVLFARKNNDGSVTPIQFANQSQQGYITDFTNLYFIESYADSPVYFITGNDVILNPYINIVNGGTAAISSNATYVDSTSPEQPNNFANTLLYNYTYNTGALPTNVSKVNIASEDYNKYIQKQKIKILKRELLTSVVSAIQTALNGDNVGKIFKVEL
jgi:hypothetical protein